MQTFQIFKSQIELQCLLFKKSFIALFKRNYWAFMKFIEFSLYPMDLIRIQEYPFLISAIQNTKIKNSRIIDISSPKIISFLIKEKFEPRNFVLTSYNDKASESQISLYNSVSKNQLLLCEADATDLGNYYNKFDFLYSISVIEHIPGEGDIKAMDEFSKVVVHGGYVCITIPYGKEPKEYMDYLDSSKFSHRYYTFETIQKRLFHKNLKLCKVEIVEERYPGYYQKVRKKIISQAKFFVKYSFDKKLLLLRRLQRYFLGYWIGYIGFSKKCSEFVPIEGEGNIHLLFRVDK